MSFFTHPIPIVILALGFSVYAVPAGAEGFSAPGLRTDEDDSRHGLSGLLSDRRERRESGEWRRSSVIGTDSAPDSGRGIAARDLLEAIEDGVNAGRWIPFRHRKSRGQEILATLEQVLPEETSLAKPEGTTGAQPLRSRFRFDLARGIEYRQDLEVGDQPVKLRLHGPIVSGSPGLGLRLRSNVREHAFEVDAYGSVDEVGLQIHIGF